MSERGSMEFLDAAEFEKQRDAALEAMRRLPFRTFKVRTCAGDDIIIMAHALDVDGSGALFFSDWAQGQAGFPERLARRIFAAAMWREVEELWTSQVATTGQMH